MLIAKISEIEKDQKAGEKMEDVISSIVIDEEAGIRRVGGDREFYAELIELFIHESTRQVQELQSALAIAEAGSVEKIAHSIKGAASNVGALQVQRTAFELEILGREKMLDLADQKLEILKAQIDRVRHFIEIDN
jgi:HPt (histidine-containing phosphotransfer) domain-containing protein